MSRDQTWSRCSRSNFAPGYDDRSEYPLMPARVELFGVEIDPLRMDQAVAQIMAWVADPAGRCHFVVTPNVDHVVMLQHNAALKAAYSDAGMVLVDGAPVLWSSRLLRCGLPERFAGSDLVPALFYTVSSDWSLPQYLSGASHVVSDRSEAT